MTDQNQFGLWPLETKTQRLKHYKSTLSIANQNNHYARTEKDTEAGVE